MELIMSAVRLKRPIVRTRPDDSVSATAGVFAAG
jgi:hypothetical protein